ncbi:MAG: SCO family protein [Acidobacteria bacterium]|nr:SCO family protein [Acidobacteriota bacterium]
MTRRRENRRDAQLKKEKTDDGSRVRASWFAFRLCALASALLALWGASEVRAQQPGAHQGHEQHARETARPHYTRTVSSYTPPDVTLLDMNGTRVPLSSALGYDGPVLLQFIFTTCPTICPVMTGTLAAAQNKFGPELEKIRLISISIDPEQDTPERLQEYARKFKAKGRWLFLTGKLDDIVAVQRAFDAYRGNKMRHEPITFLRASPGENWLRLDGLMSATELVAECRRLIAR